MLWDDIGESSISQSDSGKFVPLEEHSLFLALAAEVIRFNSSHGRSDVVILVDADTAEALPQMADLVNKSTFAACAGTPPETWENIERVIPIVRPEASKDDRFLVVYSETLSFAAVGAVSANGGETAFRGGWTCDRDCVDVVLKEVRGRLDLQKDSLPEFSPVPGSGDHSVLLAMELTSAMVAQFAVRQQDIAMDRHDLFSVLEILKAISSKRRAHDVLFVFVEQIARVIDTDRCSIVQVWGGERKGRVQASHEDESVSDLAIDLEKYPELLQAMETRQKVVISDVSQHHLTRQYANELSEAGIRVLMVIPIALFDPNVGSLFLRVTRRRRSFTLREIGFCEIVAEAAGNALERAQLFERIQRANERLERLAITDALTGLYNRRHFHQRLQEEYQRSKRYELPLACIMFDIDDFKKINDTYGHLQGDTILREIAVRTNGVIRKTDICARYGGEEFVVIMPQTTLQGARSQAERLLEVLRSNKYPGMPANARVTVSVGVAVLDLETMDNCDALVAQADVALYEAKRMGKNRVMVSETSGDTT